MRVLLPKKISFDVQVAEYDINRTTSSAVSAVQFDILFDLGTVGRPWHTYNTSGNFRINLYWNLLARRFFKMINLILDTITTQFAALQIPFDMHL